MDSPSGSRKRAMTEVVEPAAKRVGAMSGTVFQPRRTASGKGQASRFIEDMQHSVTASDLSRLDAEQFNRTAVAMEVEGDIIRDHVSASHEEIQKRLNDSEVEPEKGQEVEEHLLASPLISPTKHIPDISAVRKILGDIGFKTLVARDRALHEWQDKLTGLRDWWKQNRVLWIENRAHVEQISDTIQQLRYQISARGIQANDSIGAPNQIKLQEQLRSKILIWFREQRKLMDENYHQFKELKAKIEGVAYFAERREAQNLDPNFNYENDATIRAAIRKADSPTGWSAQRVFWWLTEAEHDLGGGASHYKIKIDQVRREYQIAVQAQNQIQAIIQHQKNAGEQEDKVFENDIQKMEKQIAEDFQVALERPSEFTSKIKVARESRIPHELHIKVCISTAHLFLVYHTGITSLGHSLLSSRY